MEWNDWAELFCAVASLALAIVVAIVQHCQGKRMEEFEYRQDERDERRHAEGNKTRAIEFISKHYADRGLIPLCAVAAIHNDLFHYSRKMYWEFCCLVPEVQNLILEYCNLDLRMRKEDGLFDRCIAAVEAVLRDRFPEDEPIFYDGGKYVLRSLERHAGEKLPAVRIINPHAIVVSIEHGRGNANAITLLDRHHICFYELGVCADRAPSLFYVHLTPPVIVI